MIDFLRKRPAPEAGDPQTRIAVELEHVCALMQARQPADQALLSALAEVVGALKENTEAVTLHRLRLERVDGRLEALEIFLAARFAEYPRNRVNSPLGQEG